MMNFHLQKSAQIPALISGVAVIVLSTLALTKLPLARHPDSTFGNTGDMSTQQTDDTSTRHSASRKAKLKPKCNECGVVESMQRVNADIDAPAIYEIKVRMRDGSMHISHDANPANWRRGQHVILVGGNQT
jgi:hypothetical protein